MNIGIVAPCNPFEFKKYFSQKDIPSMNENTSSVHALVNSFLEAGHSVIVFTRNENNRWENFISERIKIYTVPYMFVPKTSIFKAQIIWNLKRVIGENISQCDVLHAHWTYEYAIAALKFANIKPVFCTIRDWCPYIMNLPMSLKGQFIWKVIHYRYFKKVVASNNIHLIANSFYTYSKFKELYPNREIPIIPNSIKREFIRKEGYPSSNCKIIVTIANGITDPRKNINNLLKAFNAYRIVNNDAKLIIIGPYDENNTVITKWKTMGLLENVELTGQISHDNIFGILDRSSMMVHPSYEETFGNVVIEAMARRIPVIGGYKSGAVPYVLEGGISGVLCDVGNSDSIKDAMVSLSDIRKVESIVDKASLFISKNFSSEVVCEKHLELYSQFLSNE